MANPSSSVPQSSYPGERLGLPESGPGSVAPFGPRVVGLLIDWGIAVALAWWLFDYHPLAVSGLFVVITAVTISLLGGSIGHIAMGMRLNTVDGRAPGWWRPLLRQLMLMLILPALIIDQDQRGGHDVISGLVLRRFARG
ncbi:MAG: RDD family protein [Microbacteriaceae bacterium]|nr:RDD family protein [Microbacteriaceae bacterium]